MTPQPAGVLQGPPSLPPCGAGDYICRTVCALCCVVPVRCGGGGGGGGGGGTQQGKREELWDLKKSRFIGGAVVHTSPPSSGRRERAVLEP